MVAITEENVTTTEQKKKIDMENVVVVVVYVAFSKELIRLSGVAILKSP